MALLSLHEDRVPVGEVFVDPYDANILGAFPCPKGEKDGGGEEEANEEALVVYGFHPSEPTALAAAVKRCNFARALCFRRLAR